MKYSAFTISTAAILGFCGSAGTIRSENQCDCQTPPGGVVRCEQGQVAFCEIKEGKVYGRCITPPVYIKTAGQYQKWLAEELFGKDKLQELFLKDSSGREALKALQKVYESGGYKAQDQTIIQFSLPPSDKTAVYEAPNSLYPRLQMKEG